MRLALAFLLALTCVTMSAAGKSSKAGQPPKVSIATVFPDQTGTPPVFTQKVTVVFTAVTPAQIHLDEVSRWTLVVFSKNGLPLTLHGYDPNTWTITGVDDSGTPFARQAATASPIVTVVKTGQTAILTLPPNTLTNVVTSLTVSFDTTHDATHGSTQLPWTPAPLPSTQLFSSAPDKTHSDVYLSGLYSPAVHSAAQYTIDAEAKLVKQIGLSHYRIGGVATVSTDKRPTADPDSFLVSGLLQWIAKDQHFLSGRAQGVLLDWDFAGLEFDRKTTTKTIISSPVFEVPLRLYPAPGAHSRVSLGMFPILGLETGTNISNALNPAGSGFIFRGVFGSSVSLTLKTKRKYLEQIGVTSNYTVRIPTINEIFTNTHYISATGKTVDLPVMSHQARNHVQTQLDLTLAKPFSITIKHEYGELPPGFQVVHNSVSIGLTVMLQQNNSALSKVDPEK